MPIDAQIPLSVRTPPPAESPLQTVTGLMQLRNSGAEYALRQAQAADAQAQAQQRARDLQDQNTVQDAMKDPEAAPKIATGDFSPLYGRVQPHVLDSLRVAQDTHKTALLSQSEKTNQEVAEDTGVIKQTLESLKDFISNDANEADLPTVSAQAIASLKQQDRFRHFTGAQIPDVITDPKQIDTALAVIGAQHAAVNDALATRKAREENEKLVQEAAAKEAEANKTKAETPGIEAESEMKGIQRDLMKAATSGDSAGAESLIDQRIPVGEFPESQALNQSAKVAYRLALQNGAKPAEAAAAAEKIAGVVDDLRKQKGEIPAEVSKAVQVERAKAPIEQARAIATANTNRANTGAEKLDADYNIARAQTESLGRILDLADQGNKAAGANIALAGVGALNAVNSIKRINSAEIRQYGTAGSLLDKIQGKLQGWTEGKPIPQDVLDDIRALHQELGTQAYEKYTSGLKSLEARTPGANLPPTLPAPNIRKSGIPIPASQAEYDALPKGAQFKKPNDPVVYTKQ